MKFLQYDSPLMVFLRNLVDYVTVGILWFFFSIPIFTSGAATTAALLTAEISVRKDEGRILKTFWKWFRKDFKEATLLWLIRLPVVLLVFANVFLVQASQLPSWLQIAIYVASGVVFCWVQLWFGYLSKFDDPIKTVLHNTFRMALGSVGRALLLGILAIVAMVGALVLAILMPPLLVLVPGTYLILYTAVIRKLFARYLPKEETEEQKTEQQEQEQIPAET